MLILSMDFIFASFLSPSRLRNLLDPEVVVIQVVNPDVPVLPPRGEGPAIRVPRQGVDGPEVPADSPDLVLEDFVMNFGIELPRFARRRRDAHRVLPPPKNDVVQNRRNNRRVHRPVRGVGFQTLHGFRIEQPGGFI